MKHATTLENGLAGKTPKTYFITMKVRPYNEKYCGATCPQRLQSHFGQVFYCRLFSESFSKCDSLQHDNENFCVKRHTKCIESVKNA
jgi:hypothetical protein